MGMIASELRVGCTYATRIGRRHTVIEVLAVTPTGKAFAREAIGNNRGQTHLLPASKIWHEVIREEGHPTRWQRVRRIG